MRSKELYLVITFDSTTMAFHMESFNQEGRLIPLPESIDAGCGLAFATKNMDKAYWLDFLRQHQVKYNKIVEVEI